MIMVHYFQGFGPLLVHFWSIQRRQFVTQEFHKDDIVGVKDVTVIKLDEKSLIKILRDFESVLNESFPVFDAYAKTRRE